MSKRQILILLGIWVMIFLFLGFPSAWDKAFALIAGALIAIISYRGMPAGKTQSADMPFIEHKAPAARPLPAFVPTASTTPVVAPEAPAMDLEAPSDRVLTNPEISETP